jgi:hypothetical protein
MKLEHDSKPDSVEKAKPRFRKEPLMDRMAKKAVAALFAVSIAACTYQVPGITVEENQTQDGGTGGNSDGGTGGVTDGGAGGVTDGGAGGVTDGGAGGVTDGGTAGTDAGSGGMDGGAGGMDAGTGGMDAGTGGMDGGAGGDAGSGPLCSGVHDQSVTAMSFPKNSPQTVGGYSFEYTTTGASSATFDILCGSDSTVIALGQVFPLSVTTTINVPTDGERIVFTLTGKNSLSATADVTVEPLP